MADRKNFGKLTDVIEAPDLIELQTNSYAEFLQQGVAPSRMQAIGFGETQPIADNSTPEGRQLNRRVVVTIAPQQGASY